MLKSVYFSWVVFGFCIVTIVVWSLIAILSIVIFRSARMYFLSISTLFLRCIYCDFSAFRDKGANIKMRSDMRSAVIKELSLSV